MKNLYRHRMALITINGNGIMIVLDYSERALFHDHCFYPKVLLILYRPLIIESERRSTPLAKKTLIFVDLSNQLLPKFKGD